MEQNKMETLENFFIEKYKKIEEENEQLKKEVKEKDEIEKQLGLAISRIKALMDNAKIIIEDNLHPNPANRKIQVKLQSCMDFNGLDLENGVYLKNNTIGSKFLDFIIIFGKLSDENKKELMKFRQGDEM